MSVGSIGAPIPGLTAPALPQVKSAPAAANVAVSLSAQHSAAALEGQIRAAREQLNDWVTCVSATTPKGQAEIRSLSAQISAAQEQIHRLPPPHAASGAAGAAGTGSRLDVWA